MLSDLVKKYPEDLIRTQHDNISAYGDFAALLPWNLWISVKSGYAKRDFLLLDTKPNFRHGFQDPEGDFKGEIRLRNYKLADLLQYTFGQASDRGAIRK